MLSNYFRWYHRNIANNLIQNNIVTINGYNIFNDTQVKVNILLENNQLFVNCF